MPVVSTVPDLIDALRDENYVRQVNTECGARVPVPLAAGVNSNGEAKDEFDFRYPRALRAPLASPSPSAVRGVGLSLAWGVVVKALSAAHLYRPCFDAKPRARG